MEIGEGRERDKRKSCRRGEEEKKIVKKEG